MSGWNMPPGISTADLESRFADMADCDYVIGFMILPVKGKAVPPDIADKVIDYLADVNSPLCELDGTFSVMEVDKLEPRQPS